MSRGKLKYDTTLMGLMAHAQTTYKQSKTSLPGTTDYAALAQTPVADHSSQQQATDTLSHGNKMTLSKEKAEI